MSYREVDLWVAKAVRCRHRMPHKEGELEGHYFHDLQDGESGEHMDLIINNCLGLGLCRGVVVFQDLLSNVVLNDLGCNLWLDLH